MRGSARIYDVRVAQFVLKIEKLSHIMGPRASQDLRSPSLIMAPADIRLVFRSSLGNQQIFIMLSISERHFYNLAIFLFSEIVIFMINW